MDVDARLEALEAENERQRDEIERLKQLLGSGPFVAPIEFRLTPKESGVLGILLRRDLCSKEQILDGLYVAGVDDEPQVKIIDVFICRARKKLKPYGVTIGTAWGHGYYMTDESKAIVLAMLEKPHQQAAA